MSNHNFDTRAVRPRPPSPLPGLHGIGSLGFYSSFAGPNLKLKDGQFNPCLFMLLLSGKASYAWLRVTSSQLGPTHLRRPKDAMQFLALLCATAQQSYSRHVGDRRPSVKPVFSEVN